MMDQAERERLAQRIREEIDEQGSECNPAYIEEKLEQDIAGLLRWMQENLKDTGPTIAETIYHAECYQISGDEHNRAVLHLGTRILVSRFKTILFFLHEIQARIGAIEVKQRAKLIGE